MVDVQLWLIWWVQMPLHMIHITILPSRLCKWPVTITEINHMMKIITYFKILISSEFCFYREKWIQPIPEKNPFLSFINSLSPVYHLYWKKQLSFHLTLCNISKTLLGDYLLREQDVTGYRISRSTAWLTICLRHVVQRLLSSSGFGCCLKGQQRDSN